MNKKLLTLLMAAGIAVVFLVTGLQAGTTVSDVITMESSIYKKRSKGPGNKKKPTKLCEFTHKKHTEYEGITCGSCHHDDKGKPLDLKMGDDVQKCQECHNRAKPKKSEAKFKGVYLGKKRPADIFSHKNALHENCIGCHMKANMKAGDPKGKKGPAPTGCKACHIPM